MKKNFRKYISLLLCVGILLSFNCTYVIAEDNYDDIARATNVLLQSGWTQEEIDDFLTEEALLAYKDAEPAVVSEKKYFKVTTDSIQEVTKEECESGVAEALRIENNEVSPAAIIPGGQTVYDEVVTTDGYMEYYVSAYNAGGDGEYIISARYEWLTNPIFTDEDVFGLGHDTNLTQLSDYDVYYVYKVDYRYTMGTTVIENTDTYTTPDGINIDNGGTVVKQDLSTSAYLENGDGTSFSHHRGFLQYCVRVNNPNVNTVAIYAEYLHQQHVISVSPSISYPAGGSIGVTYESKFKRMSPNPYLSFEV